MSSIAADITYADLLSLPDDTFITLTRNAVQVQVALSTLRAASHAHVVQAATPLTGTTVVMTDSSMSGTLYLTPAGTLAALTVTLPTEANSVIGEERSIFTTQTLTSLTINGATTIQGAPTTLAANSVATMRKVAANTWVRA